MAEPFDVDALARIHRRPDGKRLCSLPLCDGTYWCKGMCNRHHKQWKRTGNPLTNGDKGGPPPTPKLPGWLDLDRLARTRPLPGWETYGTCYENGATPRFYSTANKRTLAPCQNCPARYACLATALARPHTDDHGIWGGTTRNERHRIRTALKTRQRNAA